MRNRSNKFCPASCHDFVTRQALRKSFIFADYSVIAAAPAQRLFFGVAIARRPCDGVA